MIVFTMEQLNVKQAGVHQGYSKAAFFLTGQENNSAAPQSKLRVAGHGSEDMLSICSPEGDC